MKTGIMNVGRLGIRWMQLAVMASVLCLLTPAQADRTWTGTNGWWSDAGMWTPNGVPGDGENVTMRPGNYTNYIGESSSNLLSFTQYGGTLIFTNWTTALRATDVVMATGRMTHALCDTNVFVDNTNRVWIVATNLTIKSNAQINVDAVGFRGGPGTGGSFTNGQGPGGARYVTDGTSGGGYGGRGGGTYYAAALPGEPYGESDKPFWSGSGGAGRNTSAGGNGGGAIRLEVANRLSVHGAITAGGGKGNGCGSGGGISIVCAAIAGTGGVIRADGGNLSGNEAGTVGGGGGGGRVAVIYDAMAQSYLPRPEIRFSAAHGCGDPYNNQNASRNGFPGTVYFTDSQVMQTTLYDRDGGQFLLGTTTNFEVPAFTVTSSNRIHTAAVSPNDADNTWAIFPEIRGLTVSNRLSIINGARLEFSNCVARIGDGVTVTNRSRLYVLAGETNSGTAAYGSLIAVTNDVLIANGSWVSPVSHGTNGGSVLWKVGSLNIATTNAGFNADGFGYGSKTQYFNIYTNVGYGPGGGGYRSGGGYGGQGSGSYPGKAYGNTNAPIQCGSGGGYQQNGIGQAGGGLVWIEASGAVSLSGTIVARGVATAPGGYDGAGAGGGIFIRCAEFSGTTDAVMSVKGGNGVNAGAGGGGRIAVWYRTVSEENAQKIKANQMSQVVGTPFISTNYPGFLGVASAPAGTGGTAGAQPGSVVFLAIGRAPGTLMIVK